MDTRVVSATESITVGSLVPTADRSVYEDIIEANNTNNWICQHATFERTYDTQIIKASDYISYTIAKAIQKFAKPLLAIMGVSGVVDVSSGMFDVTLEDLPLVPKSVVGICFRVLP